MSLPLGRGNTQLCEVVYNAEASATIERGMIVKFSTAAVGVTDATAVLKATSGAAGSRLACGVALEDIPAGKYGRICVFGVVDKVRVEGSGANAIAANEAISMVDAAASGIGCDGGTGGDNRFGYALTAAAEDTTGSGVYYCGARVNFLGLNVDATAAITSGGR